ncbi:cell surface glycoprotein 1 isoform X3 [Anabas testudineus]|uniref:cell surface glycoprotein 1 isoform X3 n=1 Tax=Anabas testudineus TaxID=64144 RepID=UPI000E45FCA1|nr:cell surface glycoprotein 1 isoform X3 [Anabas testudineus]
MMSYLWILLLGSLLASSAKAQDDVAPTEEAAGDPEPSAPEADTEPVLDGEQGADEETEQTAEEIPPDANEPEPAAEPAATSMTPSDDDAGLAAPAGDDVQPTPAADDVEPAAEDGDSEAEDTADGDTESLTPAADPEVEAATTKAPEADPEIGDPEIGDPEGGDPEGGDPEGGDAEGGDAEGGDAEVEQTTDITEVEEPSASTNAPPAPEESGPDDKPTPEPDQTAGDDVEEPTDAVDEFPDAIVPDSREDVKNPAPEDPEGGDAEVEQTTDNTEVEEPSASTIAPPAPEESGPDDKSSSEPDQTAGDDEEEPTDPTSNADVVDDYADLIVPNSREEVKNDAPEADGFNLEDALSELNPHPGKGRSVDLEAQATGTKEDADSPQAKASSGTLAGILCAIGVAAVGAVTGYFTYQRKQLCFKNRQADPEAARKADAAEAQSDPQVLSNLLKSS